MHQVIQKKTALVLAGTENVIPYIGTFLISLNKIHPNFTNDIIVFYDTISSIYSEKLKKIPNIVLKKYETPFENIDEFDDVVLNNFTPMVFAKYECIRLLNDYSCIIWMDYDMVVASDISELLKPVDSGLRLIITPSISDSFLPNQNKVVMEEYKELNGIHGSVMVFYDTLKRREEIYWWCIDKTNELKSTLRLPEQAVFSLMINEFAIAVYPIDFNLYSKHPESKKTYYDKYVKIWHCYGPRKFWNGVKCKVFDECYDLWKSL